MEEFDLEMVSRLDFYKAQEYVKKYFLPLKNGRHAIYMDGHFQWMDKRVVRTTYLNRMEKEIESVGIFTNTRHYKG